VTALNLQNKKKTFFVSFSFATYATSRTEPSNKDLLLIANNLPGEPQGIPYIPLNNAYRAGK